MKRLLALPLVAVGGVLFAAPAPKAKPTPPRVAPGEWVLVAQGGESPVTLTPGGAWVCDWYGERWVGRWSFCPKSQTLEVVEQRDAPDSFPLTWAVTLGAAREGTTQGEWPGVGVRLVPRPRGVP